MLHKARVKPMTAGAAMLMLALFPAEPASAGELVTIVPEAHYPEGPLWHDGKLYFADEFNQRVRAWDPITDTVVTVAGNGEAKFAGDGGLAVDASLNQPAGLGFDDDGHLFIVDTYNHRIRRVNL